MHLVQSVKASRASQGCCAGYRKLPSTCTGVCGMKLHDCFFENLHHRCFGSSVPSGLTRSDPLERDGSQSLPLGHLSRIPTLPKLL